MGEGTIVGSGGVHRRKSSYFSELKRIIWVSYFMLKRKSSASNKTPHSRKSDAAPKAGGKTT
ncbi:MAG TPA: hypothetical protein VGF90_07580, partial [Verrucomicrobiae bacterium]